MVLEGVEIGEQEGDVWCVNDHGFGYYG